jgi:alpha-tubulin suppressor-like RCC1 family protein
MTPLLLRGRFLAWAVAVPLALLSTACGGQKAAGAAAADCPAGQVHCTPAAPCDPGAPGPVTAIVSGDFHVCALFTNGTVRCWGDNRYGQLGVGVSCLPASGRPLPVSNLWGVRALAAGNLHTCALLDDGTVKCWGATGIADTKTPMTIDAGPLPPCPIITSTGAAEMFGSSPGTVPGLTGPTAITTGYGESDCALLVDGTVRCWGFDGDGELGNGTIEASDVLPPVAVSNLSGVTAIGNGPFHDCAVKSDGHVACWGANESGELGNGTTTASSVPVAVANLTNAIAVTANGPAGGPGCAACYAYTCALLADSTVACWGESQDGETGGGATHLTATTTPAPVLNLTGVKSIVAGEGHVFAVLSDGTLTAWGANRCGELGNGTTTHQPSPVHVSGIEHAVAVGSGQCHACALLADGGVDCWGDNGEGELGIGVLAYGDGGVSQSLTATPVVWQ